jgi:DnaJ-class molecular chaperone
MTLNQAFEVMGITKQSSLKDCKAAYRRLCMEHHPDRGGSHDKFFEIQTSYKKVLEYVKQPVICEVCTGSGSISKMNGFNTIRTPCQFCNGTGEVIK